MQHMPSTREVFQVAEGLRDSYRLRGVVRWGHEKHEELPIETVAEHSHNTKILADLFYLMGETSSRVDCARVHTLLRYHDLPEVGKGGDKPQTMKSAKDEVSCKRELSDILERFPRVMRTHVEEAILEFEEATTLEARFALACDKLEPSFELYLHGVHRLLPPHSRCIPTGSWHGWTADARRRATEEFPLMYHYGEVLGRFIEREIEPYRPRQAAE